MQKRGVARADQAVIDISDSTMKDKEFRLTDGNNVAEETKFTKVELALDNLLAPT